MLGALDNAAAGGAQAVVLTGTGTVFSAGVDLHRVIAGRDEYLASFLPELRKVFTRLATFELPMVAAVNGHAITGGYILAAAADRILDGIGKGQGRRHRPAGRPPLPGDSSGTAAHARRRHPGPPAYHWRRHVPGRVRRWPAT